MVTKTPPRPPAGTAVQPESNGSLKPKDSPASAANVAAIASALLFAEPSVNTNVLAFSAKAARTAKDSAPSPLAVAANRVALIATMKSKAGIREDFAPNVTITTNFYTAVKGWGDGYANCAMGTSHIGWCAGVFDVKDFSALATGLADILAAKGLALAGPEIGCLLTYKSPWYPAGHSEICVAKDADPDYVWAYGENTGNGSATGEGDGGYINRRYIKGQMYVHGFCRFPGVAAGKKMPAIPTWYGRFLYDRSMGHTGFTGGLLGKGPDVTHVQRLLKMKAPDARYGTSTAAAAKRWQKANGLPAYGAIDLPTALLMDRKAV